MHANDPDSWFETIWDALHDYRENNIPEGTPAYDDQWSDITTAMAWIKEQIIPDTGLLTSEQREKMVGYLADQAMAEDPRWYVVGHFLRLNDIDLKQEFSDQGGSLE